MRLFRLRHVQFHYQQSLCSPVAPTNHWDRSPSERQKGRWSHWIQLRVPCTQSRSFSLLHRLRRLSWLPQPQRSRKPSREILASYRNPHQRNLIVPRSSYVSLRKLYHNLAEMRCMLYDPPKYHPHASIQEDLYDNAWEILVPHTSSLQKCKPYLHQ